MRPGLLLLVVASTLVAFAARADDDLVLDLGGEKLETRHVVHGTFIEGAPLAEPGHDKDEEPAHQVTISRDFWMGKYPVTKGQFAKFVSDTRYVSDAEKGPTGGAGWDGKALVQKKDFSWKNPGFTQTDEHPVVLVTYGDANAFAGWASRKTGKRVRLPTEAEWEYAARGGTTTPWYGASAEAEAAALGWFKINAGNGTRPVGQKKPNLLGLFDMSGNVFEWCRDIHAPYREGAAIDPEATVNTGTEPERRVLRGGSWLRDVKRGRSAARYRNTPGSRNADNGFRVVVTNEEAVGPGVTGATTDFAPSAPLGVGGGTGAASGGAGPTPTSGPLADGEPTRLDPIAHTSDAFSWGLLLASPLAAASAVVAWMLLRRKRPAGTAANPSGISTRASEDGFFVRAPHAPPGSRARYECMVNGTQVTDVVPLAGDETFIYTGSPPTGIRIAEIIAGQAGGYRTADRPPSSSPAGVDPDLVPPSSSRRGPPPVPPPRKSGPLPVPGPGSTAVRPHVYASPLLRDSPGPIIVPITTAATDTTSPVAAALPSSDSFLGNPRAY